MATDDDRSFTALMTVRGLVKWFDSARGFGFVTSEDGSGDILLHANTLRNYGLSSLPDGSEVEIVVQSSPKGLQAVDVLSVNAPPAQRGAFVECDALSPEQINEILIEPARVKWFDRAKGFGFANAFGSDADVFLHVEVLRRAGLADLRPGEAICLRMMHGERGLMAVQILPWEAAIDAEEVP